MTVRQIANKVIKDIKAWPDSAKQTHIVAGPKTCWDEYKKLVQHQEYDPFNVLEETIESLVRDEVKELSLPVINKIHLSMSEKYISMTMEGKIKDITSLTYHIIRSDAESQEIEYNKSEKR